MKVRTRIGTGVVVVAAIGMVLALRNTSPARSSVSATQPATGELDAAAKLGFAGTIGCSGRACHGGAEPVKGQLIQRNEYSTSLAYDKHPRAYQVLFGEQAQTIARNLGSGHPAHEDVRCLACHAIPQLAVESPSKEVLALRSCGVGCEACHGPADLAGKSWLYEHTGTAWKQFAPEKKKEYGMTPLGDVKTQAQICAGCHVGAPADKDKGIPARDCNHDIMAAGHPRLNFELSVFRANMPPHWNLDAKEKTHGRSYEAKIWAVGQVASAKASLELLVHRANDPKLPWPEFAEFGCFSCHADLQNPSWRQARGYSGRLPGSLPYDTWYSTMLPVVAAFAAPRMQDIQGSFSQIGKASRSRFDAGGLARATALQLDAWLTELNHQDFSAASIGKARQALGANDKNARQLDWDELAHIMLAAAALNQADPKEGVQSRIDLLARALAFPPGYDSPRGFPSTQGLDQAFKHLLEQLRK